MEGISLEFWHWWVLAVVLALLEMFVPGAALVWLGMAAGLVGLALLVVPDLSWQVQFGAFAVLGIASVVGARFVPKTDPGDTDQPHLNRRAEQYVGQTVPLETDIVNGRGRARVGDTLWTVTGPDLARATPVRVVGADGLVLKVEPLDGPKAA